MLELSPKKLEEKQNQGMASQLVLKFSTFLDNDKLPKNEVVKAINSSLYDLNLNDPKLAHCVLEQLQKKYPAINALYPFGFIK